MASPGAEGKIMKSPSSIRFWVEAGLSVSCGFLFLLTLLWRDWIEAVTGFDPDHHSGFLEWNIVAALAAASVLCGLMARAEWRERKRRRRIASSVA